MPCYDVCALVVPVAVLHLLYNHDRANSLYYYFLLPVILFVTGTRLCMVGSETSFEVEWKFKRKLH